MKFFTTKQPSKDLLKKVECIKDELLKNPPAFFQIEKNSFIEACETAYEEFMNFEHLLVLGIGGSVLGTQSVIQALKKDDKITILDNIDSEEIKNKLEKINWNKTCVNVISKSGNTLETMIQLTIVEKILKEKYPEKFSERIVCTTGLNSKLYKHAEENNYSIIPVPEEVGGRFSVLTPVGIFPLLFAGANVNKLLEGSEKVISHESKINSQFVALQYHSYIEEKRSITVLMTYHKKLLGLLDWYRQLLAESIGKNEKIGITPVLAFGSTDQHSQIQLYNEGPQDKLIFFLSAPFEKDSEKFEVMGIEKKIGISEAQSALFEGTKKGLEKHNKPYIEIKLDKVDEKEIGEFLMTCMIQITILAELFGVNAFNQPGVEEGKVQAKIILS